MKVIAIIVGVVLVVIMALFGICACILSSECSRYKEYERKKK
jgi:hypothetical protein